MKKSELKSGMEIVFRTDKYEFSYRTVMLGTENGDVICQFDNLGNGSSFAYNFIGLDLISEDLKIDAYPSIGEVIAIMDIEGNAIWTKQE